MFKKLIEWSQQYHDLPWRQKRTLYRTLVSEIMLQQTTVGTVLNHFEKFMKEYPSIFALAQASEERLTISWKGLGYYRRARNLKKACEFIVKEFQGEIPLDYETLISIPGIGDYTANALMAIGKNLPTLALDANLERVISRYYGIDKEKGIKLQKEIKKRFSEGKVTPEIIKLGARNLNEALMDLGRVLCKARKVSCDLCPLKESCVALKTNKVLELPIVKEKKKEQMHELKIIRFIVKKGSKILAYKKSEKEWLSGQYELPTFIYSTTDQSLKQYPEIKKKLKLENFKSYKTGITKYKIENFIVHLSKKDFDKLSLSREYTYVDFEQNQNFSTASFKALKS